jgi:hypothetical protein
MAALSPADDLYQYETTKKLLDSVFNIHPVFMC